jgi:hypothetical protein
MDCPECHVPATGWCPSGQRKHGQCPCCALCVREDGSRRHCGGNSPDIAKRRIAHDHKVPMRPINGRDA